MFGFVFGFVSGAIAGAYAAQNYELPNVKDWMSNFKDMAKQYEKKPKDSGARMRDICKSFNIQYKDCVLMNDGGVKMTPQSVVNM